MWYTNACSLVNIGRRGKGWDLKSDSNFILPPTSCVALDMLLNLSEPQSAHLLNGDCNNNHYLAGVF